jgi:ribosome-binding factor A
MAKIFVSVLNPSSDRTLTILREALPQIRSAVAHSLRIKKIPQLALELDQSVANGARIAALLAGKVHT